ncbi:hypothetical protein GCM10009828_097640 [Actinoplanes couchii]
MPSGSGRDQTTSKGSVIFARVSRPSWYVNADAVNSADARDLRFDLNRGYRARFSQNAVNPPCRCRRHCCNGTHDTSFRNASSPVFFQAVSIAEVAV